MLGLIIYIISDISNIHLLCINTIYCALFLLVRSIFSQFENKVASIHYWPDAEEFI